jgi:HEAT repeat protein
MPLIRSKSGAAGPDDVGTSAPSLVSTSPEERWAAARTAGVPADIPALARALACEGDNRVREAIFTALAKIATAESALAVLPYLRSDEANARTSALDALRAMPYAAQPHLAALLADDDPDVRLLACDLGRNIGDAEGQRLLCALLDAEPRADVCAAAVEVLTEIADLSALPALSRCASRFPRDPFLGFAIAVAVDRLRAGSAAPRG